MTDINTDMKPKRGPGRPPGRKNDKTLERERIERERMQAEIEKEVEKRMKKMNRVQKGRKSDKKIDCVLSKTEGIRLEGHNGSFRVIKACGPYSMLESEQMGQKAYNIIMKNKRIFAEDVDGFRDPRSRYVLFGDKALPDSVVKSKEMKEHIARVKADVAKRATMSHAKLARTRKSKVRKADRFEFEGFIHSEDDLYDLMRDRIGETEFDEWLDDAFGTVEIAEGTYDTSYALKQVSPTDYRIVMGEYIDSLVTDAIFELNNASDGEEIYIGPFYITAVEESEDMEKSRRTKSDVRKDTSARDEREYINMEKVFGGIEELKFDLVNVRLNERIDTLISIWQNNVGDISVIENLDRARSTYWDLYSQLADASLDAYKFYQGQMAWSPTMGEEGNWTNKSRKSRARKGDDIPQYGMDPMDPPKNPKPKESVSDEGKPETDPDMPMPHEVPDTDEARAEKDEAIEDADIPTMEKGCGDDEFDIEKMIADIRNGKADWLSKAEDDDDETEAEEAEESTESVEDKEEVSEAEEYAESDEEGEELEEEAEEEMDEGSDDEGDEFDIEKMIADIRNGGSERTEKDDAYGEPVGILTQPFANNYRTVVMGQGKNVPIQPQSGKTVRF